MKRVYIVVLTVLVILSAFLIVQAQNNNQGSTVTEAVVTPTAIPAAEENKNETVQEVVKESGSEQKTTNDPSTDLEETNGPTPEQEETNEPVTEQETTNEPTLEQEETNEPTPTQEETNEPVTEQETTNEPEQQPADSEKDNTGETEQQPTVETQEQTETPEVKGTETVSETTEVPVQTEVPATTPLPTETPEPTEAPVDDHVYDEVIVSIKGSQVSVTYDGQRHQATGYEVTGISNDAYQVSDFIFTGTASAELYDAGVAYMGLNGGMFVNKNNKFVNVYFDVEDGFIEIYPINVEIEIIGNSETVEFDGETHSVYGYEFKQIRPESPQIVTAESFGLKDGKEPFVESDKVGVIGMGLNNSSFENYNPNFNRVLFNVTDGFIEIIPSEQYLLEQELLETEQLLEDELLNEDQPEVTETVPAENNETVTETQETEVTPEATETVPAENNETVTETQETEVTPEATEIVPAENNETVTETQETEVTPEATETVPAENNETVTETQETEVTPEATETVPAENNETVTETQETEVTPEATETVPAENGEAVTETQETEVTPEATETAAAETAEESEDKDNTILLTAGTVIYTAPDEAAETVAELEQDLEFAVISTDETGWTSIQLDEETVGYVFIVKENEEETPAEETEADVPEIVTDTDVPFAAGTVIFTAADETSDVIMTLEEDSELYVLTAEENGWISVRLDDETVGYILTATEQAADVTEEETEETETKEKPIVFKMGTAFLAEPNESAEVIATLEEDTELLILSIDSFGWAKVQLDEELVGYILLTEELLEEIEAEEPDEYQTPVAAGTVIRVNADGMSDIIYTAETDIFVKVLGKDEDWVHVETKDGIVGYIFHSDIQLNEDQDEESENTNEPTAKVLIFTSRRAIMDLGEEIKLTSIIEGMPEDVTLNYQWECDKGEGFEPVEDGTSDSYSYEASVESLSWSWRLVVTY